MSGVKHIVQNGSRQHVISWIGTDNGVIRRCSCAACEINALSTKTTGGE